MAQSYPFTSLATLKYKSPPGSTPLSFAKGDRVLVLSPADEEGDWYNGKVESTGAEGVFPSSFVERIEQEEEEEVVEEKVDNAPTTGTMVEDDETKVDEVAQATTEPTPSAAPLPPPTTTNIVEPTSIPSQSIPTPTSPTPTLPTAPAPAPPPTPSSSAPPPAPAPKSSSLKDRIAALNAAGAGAAAPPGVGPPLPRPKPSFKRSIPPPTTTAQTPSSPPLAVRTPSPELEREKTAPSNKGFSADDAKESIGRGGGSLKERMAALQGLSLDSTKDVPSAPGRAPKPWKRPVAPPPPVPVEEPEVEEKEKEEKEEEKEEEKVPAFSPAEEGEEGDKELGVDPKVVEEPEAIAQPLGIDELPTSPSKRADSNLPSPVAPTTNTTTDDVESKEEEQKEEEQEPLSEEDQEAARRAALAKRMASLGGQKVGMSMPALPKRAGKPKKKVVTPVSTEVASEEKVEEEKVVPATEVQAGKEEDDLPGDLKSVGGEVGLSEGAKGLLEQSKKEDEDEVESKKDDAADDDFETPALPNTSSPSSPTILAAPLPSEVFDHIEKGHDEPLLRPVTPPSAPNPSSTTTEQHDIPPPARSIPSPEVSHVEDISSPIVVPQVLEEESTFDEERSTPPPPPPARLPPPPRAVPLDESDDEVERGEKEELEDELVKSDGTKDVGAEDEEDDDAVEQEQQENEVVDEPSSTTKPSLASLDTTLPPPPLPSSIRQAQPTSPISPTSTASSVRPIIPPSFTPTSPKAFQPPPPSTYLGGGVPPARAPPIPTFAVEQEEEEESIPTPTSPATASRPAIPRIPSQFDGKPTPLVALTRAPVEIPRSETEDEEEEEEQFAKKGREVEESEESPMDPGLSRGGASASVPLAPTPVSKAVAEDDDEEEEEEEDEEEEEEEEEDPEVARKRALTARMAKLSGGMRLGLGPMMPPVGGVKPTKTVKKKKKRVVTAPVDEESDAATSPVVEGQNDDETAPPPPPSRSYGGFPTGGFAPPGISAPRPVAPEPAEEEQTTEDVAQVDDEQDTVEGEVPSPLPKGRPSSSLPPRRSIPTPAADNDDEEEESYDAPVPPSLPSGRPLPPQPQVTNTFVEEPAQADYYNDEEQEQAPPPPPPRSSIPRPPSSAPPPLPPTASPPSSPQRNIKRDSFASLGRTLSRSSANNEGPIGARGSIDFDRELPSPGGGAPIEQRYSSTSSLRVDAPLPVLPESNSTTSLTKDQLLQLSSSLGAQIFAAAHSKLSDKQAKFTSDQQLLEFCFSRAIDAKTPQGWEFGQEVFKVDGGKNAIVEGVDEPRAGDVALFWDTKFKHNLSSTRLGTSELPRIFIVASYDSSKQKLRTVEVGMKDGAVVEGAHRLLDLKEGKVVVQRVLAAR